MHCINRQCTQLINCNYLNIINIVIHRLLKIGFASAKTSKDARVGKLIISTVQIASIKIPLYELFSGLLMGILQFDPPGSVLMDGLGLLYVRLHKHQRLNLAI